MQPADVALRDKFKLKVEPPKVDFQSGGEGAEVFFQVKGLEQLAATLRSMPKIARRTAGVEMANIAHEVIADARDNYVPYKSGALHDSGDADEYSESMDSEITQIAMWFGGPLSATQGHGGEAAVTFEGERFTATGKGVSTDKKKIVDAAEYAFQQHEYMHKSYTKLGTGPKYLELPLMKIIDTIGPRIANAVGLSWGGGDASPAFFSGGKEEKLNSIGASATVKVVEGLL